MESIDLITNASDPSNLEETVIQNERIEALRAAIKALSKAEQQVINLGLEGLPQKKIGDHLGISQPKVSQLKKSAMMKLSIMLRGIESDKSEDIEIAKPTLIAEISEQQRPLEYVEETFATEVDTENLAALWTFCTETIKNPWGRNNPDQIFFVV